jgi:putative drug exporter of the RND superfamily
VRPRGRRGGADQRVGPAGHKGGTVVTLARFVLRHRLLVGVGWLLLFLAALPAAGAAVDRLTFDFSLPGQEGYETSKQIVEAYGNGTDFGSHLFTVTVPEGETVAGRRADVDGVFTALQGEFPQYRVAWAGNTGDDRFVTDDGRTAYGLVVERPLAGFADLPAYRVAEPLLAELEASTGLDIGTTGYFQLSEGDAAEGGNEPPSVLRETAFAGLMALVVLLFVFASVMALLPLLVAAVSILVTFLCLLGLTYLTDVSFIVQFLVSLVGLGVAIDYSLLVVNRWREEREHGRENADAVVESMRTAGHAVVSSAGTVAISLLALVVVPVPFLRSMGLGGLLIPLVSSAVVLTLLPAILGSIGPKADWPHLRHEFAASRAWTAWARVVYRRRWLAAAAGALLIGALAAPVLSISVGQARTESLASQGPAVQTLALLRDGGVPAGAVTPLEVLVGTDGAAAAADRAEQVDGVAFAFTVDDPTWVAGDRAVVGVVPERELVDIASSGVAERVREAVLEVPGAVGVAGPGATVLDYDDAVFGAFPWVIALIALTTFLLLVRAFRSLLLPLKAVLLNVVSVAATFGFVVLFWQYGWGSEAVFGIEATGAVTFWLPVLIFAFLFGLSMDYEVFILSRMREEYDRTGSTRTAVVEGLGRTGRLVTCAALILFLAFIALAGIPGTDIKMLATALAVGILLDATVVRALLVPALVSLMGKYNWWLPAWLARPLLVEPSPLRDETEDQPIDVRDRLPGQVRAAPESTEPVS